jgi:hypothetical protein
MKRVKKFLILALAATTRPENDDSPEHGIS